MLRRLLSMLAYDQGGLLNSARLAQSLGLSAQAVNRYLELMVELFHVRRLPAWGGKTTKRLTKSPKVFIRDCGLLHALIDIVDEGTLVRHPVVGAAAVAANEVRVRHGVDGSLGPRQGFFSRMSS